MAERANQDQRQTPARGNSNGHSLVEQQCGGARCGPVLVVTGAQSPVLAAAESIHLPCITAAMSARHSALLSAQSTSV